MTDKELLERAKSRKFTNNIYLTERQVRICTEISEKLCSVGMCNWKLKLNWAVYEYLLREALRDNSET